MTAHERTTIENDIRADVYDIKRNLRLAQTAHDDLAVSYWQQELASVLAEYHARMESN